MAMITDQFLQKRLLQARTLTSNYLAQAERRRELELIMNPSHVIV
jgi:hypothetical protein